MVYGGGGAAAGAAAAAIANAIKASGAIIRVEPDEFQKILSRVDEPLVVRAEGGWRTKNYQYLTAYKGLIFHTKSPSELSLPSRVEMISANKIWIPD